MNAAQDMRTSLHTNFDNTDGITGIYLGGTTGGILDTKNVFVDQFNVILPIVAVGVSLVLFFVLGSLILPLFALVSVLMSINCSRVPISIQLRLTLHDPANPLRAAFGLRHGLQHLHPNPYP
jgi:uncharacterized membrane protein YdfJ with MMPL/SSD domain